MNFTHDVLEFIGELEISGRCRGAALPLYSCKPVRRPRAPFIVNGVCISETLAEQGTEVWERVFSGFMCAFNFWKTSFSDAARSKKEPVIVGSAKRLRRSVSLVGHAVGVT